MSRPKKDRAGKHEPSGARTRPAGSAAPGEELTIEERIQEIHHRVVLRTSADVHGLTELLGNRRKLLWVNFLSGLARGVGFFLGVSIVGGLVLGIVALTFDHAFAALGLQDITLKRAVTSAYGKYVEIQDLIGEAQHNIDRARAQMKTLPPPGAAPSTGGPPPAAPAAGDAPGTSPPAPGSSGGSAPATGPPPGSPR